MSTFHTLQKATGIEIHITISAPNEQQADKSLAISENERTHFGWLPPTLDKRDYSPEHPEIREITKWLDLPDPGDLKSSIDLQNSCSDIRDQLTLNSCTAFAGTGIIEYFQKRAFSKNITASPLFLYKSTRDISQSAGDTGAELRDVMKALASFGVPAERYWPYIVENYNIEPSSFLYSLAVKNKAEKYFCHDPLDENRPGDDVLTSVKQFLSVGIPAMFGFRPPSQNIPSNIPGGIPFLITEDHTSDHALVAVGYDDSIIINSNFRTVKQTKGALRIRNCRGTDWGDKGYGWLPYEYVATKRAVDFWSLISASWIDTEKFRLANNI